MAMEGREQARQTEVRLPTRAAPRVYLRGQRRQLMRGGISAQALAEFSRTPQHPETNAWPNSLAGVSSALSLRRATRDCRDF